MTRTPDPDTLHGPALAYGAALSAVQRGWAPIPVPFREKGPVVKEWQNLRLTAEQLPHYFNDQPQNIGTLLGTPSNGLTDIDLDSLEAVRLAHMFLPPTGCIFGHAGRSRSHFLYQATPPGVDTKQFEDPDGTMLVELRSTGCQTIFPPSVHPSGERIRYDDAGDPAPIDGAALQGAVARLAAAALVARHWPQEGSREKAAMALGAALLRMGWSVEDTVIFVRAVATAAGDEEIKDRVKTIQGSAAKLAKQKAVTGWPTLVALVGKDVVTKVKEWLGVTTDPHAALPDDVRAEFNARHAVVMVGGRVLILTEVTDPVFNRPDIVLSTAADLRLLYRNRPVQIGKRSVNPADLWLQAPDRRQYEGIVFDPAQTHPAHFNLWHGFAVQPRPGNCELYLAHLRENIAQNNETLFTYIVAWMADVVQHPDRRPGTALVFRSKQGAGKGILCVQFGSLFGSHFIQVHSQRHITGNFNAHLKDVLVVYADEALWAGDRAAEGALKALITEDLLPVEFKGKDVFFVRNFVRLLIASNHEWTVPAGLEERRFFIVDVGEAHLQDHAYFKALVDQMNNGGREALLHYLLHVDLTGVDLRTFPQTSALAEMKALSMTPVQRWWFDRLMSGTLPYDTRKEDAVEVRCSALHHDYLRHARHTGRSLRSSQTELGMSLRKMVPGLQRDRQTSGATRHYVWLVPPLKDCRGAFDRAMRYEHDWVEPEAMWELGGEDDPEY